MTSELKSSAARENKHEQLESDSSTNHLSDFGNRVASGITIHGVPNAIKARSTVRRVFWSLVCLAAASMFTLQFVQLLTKYYSYPKKVTIEVVPSSVPFPSISLCNMRNLDIMVLNSLNRFFKEAGSRPQEWANSTRDPFISSYLSTLAKFVPMYRRNDTELATFQTIFTRTLIATNVDRDLVVGAGVPLKEFIVTCHYGSNNCGPNDFKQFFDPYFYNCFTYNPETASHDRIFPEGVDSGWSTIVLTGSGMLDKNQDVRIIPGTHEYSSPMASSEGVRVVIHPPNSEPYPHTEGFDVPPGVSASFGIRARENIRIGSPHGSCSDHNPFGADSYDYRLISCQKKCFQQAIVQACKCKDILLPDHGLSDVPFCTHDNDVSDKCSAVVEEDCLMGLGAMYDRMMCVRNTTGRITRSAMATRECGCFSPCHEITHDVTYSLSKWPAESFDGDQAYVDIFPTGRYLERFKNETEKYQLYRKYFNQQDRRRTMKDFSRLNVYIADSNVLRTEESADYSQSQLLSDIGGQLGLWIGISVITLAEVLELVVDICKYFGRRYSSQTCGKKNQVI